MAAPAIVSTLQYNLHSIWCQQTRLILIKSLLLWRERLVREILDGTVKPLLLDILSTTIERNTAFRLHKNYSFPLCINDNEPYTIKCTLYTVNYTLYAHIRYPYTTPPYTTPHTIPLTPLHTFNYSFPLFIKGNETPKLDPV